jgi:hypothetical protein
MQSKDPAGISCLPKNPDVPAVPAEFQYGKESDPALAVICRHQCSE